ncbi:MAG: Gfo/Idh/MocA family oxidoreductase [Deltaproteobacteria bacterium]|nr:Gfo/Idh/MocA family oxidoreductase [Deltaproteobacteria bacterium]MBT8361149.1 Gfo/Idh/MocA family oxidoreductase [Deltaproteobacteria bacterium]
MIVHPELHILIIKETNENRELPWQAIGAGMEHVRVTSAPRLPANLNEFDAVITTGRLNGARDAETILRFVGAGGAWLVLVGLQESRLPDAFGVQPGPVGPASELRVLFTDAANPLGTRLPDAVYVSGTYQPLNPTADDTETVLYVDWHYSHSSVLTTSKYGDGHLACTTLQDFSPPMIHQTFYRLLRQFQGVAPKPASSFGIGILGYAPSVGKVHGLAAAETPGLHLQAACDLNPQQLAQATTDFPEITTYADGAEMAEDPLIDLVIVATAPNTHAHLSAQMLAAGKHVLCEKPLAMSQRETDMMEELARRHSRHLSCHQNRRWDPDFRAIKAAVADDMIGDLFYVETFVGGFYHPCGYWHSHAPVSGGTSYDWGAHYLDWLVALLPYPVEAVIGTRHKRVWQDVTNGDQERIQIRFADGREAEFMHTDIAAVRKPKWYLLGTTGAILGEWKDLTAIDVDPLYYFSTTDIPATEMMPDITLFKRRSSGVVEPTRAALPERNPLAFHFNLADHLLWGEPLAAPLTDSVKVVAILEAAAKSMANGGSVEAIDGR